MPLYEFECSKCKHKFEEIVKLEDLDVDEVYCPKCKKRSKRLISKSHKHLSWGKWSV